MTKREMRRAERLLQPYVERIERAGVDGGDWCITAYWRGQGGQSIFYAFDTVEEWADDIARTGK